MKRTIAILLASAFLGATMLGGCGNGPTNEPNTSAPPTAPTTESTTNAPPAALALTDLGSMTSSLLCGLAFSCCTSAEQNLFFSNFGQIPDTVAECKPIMKQQLDAYFFSGLNSAVSAGRLKYDAIAAKACLDQMQGQCAALLSPSPFSAPGCEKVFTGLVADNGACADDSECRARGSLCIFAQNATTGKCQQPPSEGQPCLNYACAEGLICAPVNNKPVCVRVLDDGAACSSSYTCMSGNCSAGRCAPPRNPGEACTDAMECITGNCDSQTNTCAALKADGATCAYHEDCQSGMCDENSKKCAMTLQCNQR